MLGVARDSSDQRLAKDTVARALEHMADGFLSVDSDWRVTYVNRNAEVFVGPMVEASGRILWEVWPHLATPGYEPLVREAARTGTPDVSRSTSWRPTGGSRSGWCRTRTAVLLRHRRHRDQSG